MIRLDMSEFMEKHTVPWIDFHPGRSATVTPGHNQNLGRAYMKAGDNPLQAPQMKFVFQLGTILDFD